MQNNQETNLNNTLDLVQGYRNVVNALRDAEQLDLADFILVDTMGRFAESADLASEYAWVAHYRHDWQGAVERWKSARRKFPNLSVAYWMEGGLLLKHLGQFDEAERVLEEGVRRFPSHAGMAIDHALAANAREDWITARDRWKALRQRYPHDQAVHDGSGVAEFGYGLATVDAGMSVITTAEPTLQSHLTVDTARDHAELMRGFASVGDNCELGLVQRHFGAEPLDLLRWNSINAGSLIQLLNNNFEGVGDPSNTVLSVNRGEYVLHDHRYGMVMHTFLQAATHPKPAAEILSQMCKRAQYLKDKIIQDLQTCERVFVYKSFPSITLRQLSDLYLSFTRYGNNKLLYVCEADEGQAFGTVEHIKDRLFIGRIDKIVRADGQWSDLSFSGWKNICSRVAAAC